MESRYSQQAGFTLIELMIASAIFIVVTVTGVSVLINATHNYRTTSEIRQALDTVSFAMEDMTRSLRLGTTFHCVNWANVDQFNSCQVNASTTPGQLGGLFLAFEGYNGNTQDPNDQVMYWLSSGVGGNNTEGMLFKKSQTSLGMPSTFYPQDMPTLFSPITPASVQIDLLKSGFSVSEPGSAYATPVITVRLAGKVTYRTTVVPFDIQSTVAPRNIPNPAQ